MTADHGGGFQLTADDAADRYEEFVTRIMAPFVTALIDATHVAENDAVLDVACGTGFVARAAAARVGSGGTVDGVDLNPLMLAVARREAPGIRWAQHAADDLPYADDSFDVVLCQQGLQFFPDPQGAIAQMARVLRPGGRLGVTVWAGIERSPYVDAQLGALTRLVGDDSPRVGAAAFQMSPERLQELFTGAGLADVDIVEVTPEITLTDLPSFVRGHFEALPWTAEAVAGHPNGLEVATQHVIDEMQQYLTGPGEIRVPFASYLAVGVLPPT